MSFSYDRHNIIDYCKKKGHRKMTITELEENYADPRAFYRLPKRLFDDLDFREMSTDAKLLYIILQLLTVTD